MIETEELIQAVLSISGETLEFEVTSILGIPSFRTDILYSQEVTNYRVEQQEFNFHVSTKDCVDNDINIDSIFTLQNTSYIFTFKLDNKPIPYLDGWSRLSVNLIGKEEV